MNVILPISNIATWSKLSLIAERTPSLFAEPIVHYIKADELANARTWLSAGVSNRHNASQRYRGKQSYIDANAMLIKRGSVGIPDESL